MHFPFSNSSVVARTSFTPMYCARGADDEVEGRGCQYHLLTFGVAFPHECKTIAEHVVFQVRFEAFPREALDNGSCETLQIGESFRILSELEDAQPIGQSVPPDDEQEVSRQYAPAWRGRCSERRKERRVRCG